MREETGRDELRLLLFGPPRAQAGNQAIDLGRRKAWALLGYLALAPTLHQREVLAALLWPEASGAHAFACLRNALWTIRRTPLADALEIGRTTVRLTAEIGVDVRQFRARMARVLRHADPPGRLCDACYEALRKAIELRDAPFLEGFGVAGAAPFEEWMLSEGRALEHEAADALARLAAHEAAEGRIDQALERVRRWLAIDPLSEAAHREAIRLQRLAGHPERALEQYRACERHLREALGLSPAPETQRLVDDLRSPGAAEVGPIDTRPHELPEWRLPFVGRGEEIDVVRRSLLDEGLRLITLTGMGGVGKSRLALRVAAELRGAFRDGVVHAEASPADSGRSLERVLARALRLTAARQDPERHGELLLTTLAGREMLLVLDRLEGRQEDFPLIEAILHRAPSIRILATRREPLGLPGESVYEVGGLPVPAATSEDDVAASPAVALFVTAAKHADLRFRPSADDFEAIGEIARLVGGLPLALELAAAWVPSLTCRQIARQVEGGLDFLASVGRDILPRHQDLRAVFDESWAQLPRRSRLILRRLSVFSGPFTYAQARAVGGAELADLAQLVRRGQLQRIGPDRYALHELLRQFAGERLDASAQERDAVQQAHARFFLACAAAHLPLLKGSEQRSALDRLQELLPEILRGWRWASRRPDGDALRAAALPLFLFYDMLTAFDEGAAAFDEAGAGLHEIIEDRSLEAFLHAAHGWFQAYRAPSRSAAALDRSAAVVADAPVDALSAFARIIIAFAGRWPSHEAHLRRLDEAIACFEAQGDPWAVALALEAGAAPRDEEDRPRAQAALERSLEIRRTLDDRWGMALALTELGRAELRGGSLTLAARRFEEALQLYRTVAEDILGVVDCLTALAWISHRLGDRDTADRRGDDALELARRTGNALRIGRCLATLAAIAVDRGDIERAGGWAEEAQRFLEGVGRRGEAAGPAALRGEMALADGRIDAAMGHFEEGEQLDPGHPRSLLGLAQIAAARGQPGRRNRLAADALQSARRRGSFPLLAEVIDASCGWISEQSRERCAAAAQALIESPHGDAWTQAIARRLLDRCGAPSRSNAQLSDAIDHLIDILREPH
jgi:predicted ATPase/DNA-binding SARP family transcriptional activator